MTRKWIEYDLKHAVNNKTRLNIIKKGYESALIGISQEHPIILKSLDKNAKIILNKITQINSLWRILNNL